MTETFEQNTDVASSRINRYELGVHKADYNIVQRLSQILGVPTAYFYAEDDALAELLLIYHRLPAEGKVELTKAAQKLMPMPMPHNDS